MKKTTLVNTVMQKRKHFGLRLREARKKAGYKTMLAFTEKHSFKERTYRSHEKGEYAAPLDVLLKYCHILNISPTWLLLGNENFAGKPFSGIFDNADLEWLSKWLEQEI